MSDNTNSNEGAKRLPDAFAQMQGKIQGDPSFGKTKGGKEYAKMRMRVSNSQKDAEGNWRNDIPSTFVDVAVFNAAQVAEIRKGVDAGTIKAGSDIGVEGYPKRDTYTDRNGVPRESWSITPRNGQSALSFDKPEAGKGMKNDIHVRGVVGKIELIEGTSQAGKDYSFIRMNTAHTDDPDWLKKREGTFEGEDRTKTTWYEATISSPKNVAAIKAKMEAGEIGVGAIVSMKASMRPDRWTDKDGNNRETMKFDVKPFEDSLEIIRAPRQSEAAKQQGDEGKVKGKGKGAKSGGRDYDDEIPF